MTRKLLGRKSTKPATGPKPTATGGELTPAERRLLQSVRGDSTAWPAGDPEPFPPPATPKRTARNSARGSATKPRVDARPAPRSDPAPQMSVVGQAMVIRGELRAAEDMIIAGRVEGSITHTANRLVIGRTGVVTAAIRARNLVVEGRIEGDITCGGTVVLKATAEVAGNIDTVRLNIADGARFNGQIAMVARQESP